MINNNLTAVFAFGSIVRGDHDELSDLDILAVVSGIRSSGIDEAVTSVIPVEWKQMDISISYYKDEKIKEMFENGDLFAWHVYNEHVSLYDPNNFLLYLGTPKKYSSSLDDINSLGKIIDSIPKNLAIFPHNSPYEAGLLYILLRSIAMSASSVLCSKPDFSRTALFHPNLPRSPITRSHFDLLMRCRIAGQRGSELPIGITADFVLDIYGEAARWVNLVRRAVSEALDEQKSEHEIPKSD